MLPSLYYTSQESHGIIRFYYITVKNFPFNTCLIFLLPFLALRLLEACIWMDGNLVPARNLQGTLVLASALFQRVLCPAFNLRCPAHFLKIPQSLCPFPCHPCEILHLPHWCKNSTTTLEILPPTVSFNNVVIEPYYN